MNNKLYLQLTVISCIVIFAKCIALRAVDELLSTSTQEVQSCRGGEFVELFGAQFQVRDDSNITILIDINENHPSLDGESLVIKIFKNNTALEFLFPNSPVGFPIEAPLASNFEPGSSNIFIVYGPSLVPIALKLRSIQVSNSGEYRIEVGTLSTSILATATSNLEFKTNCDPGGNVDPPSLKRSDGDVIVYSKTSLKYSEFLGGSFIILSSWNSISLIAEDKNNNQANTWKWYFTPNNRGRRLIEQSSTYKITEDGNSSTLLIQNCSDSLFGQYTVEVSNSAGLDSESTEINRIQIPVVNHGRSIPQDETGVIRIGQHVDITQLKNQRVVIEARDRTGFPKSKTNWFFSEWKNGIRVPIQNSENFQIVSTSKSTRLVIQNATKAGFGYYFAVASNIAGLDESSTILGESPSLLTTRRFHMVRGFVKGHIGDSFIIKGNSQISIEASLRGFPPVSFTWFERKYPLHLYSYERKIKPSSTLVIGNTLNKSILTQLVPSKSSLTKYMVIARNPLGTVNASSYALSSGV